MSDLIDRNKLYVEIIKAYEREYPIAAGVFNTFATRIVPTIIKQQPRVDAAPVIHAHWEGLDKKPIELDEDGCPVKSAFCSRCHEWLTGSEEYGCKGYYCPNCGAKMRGRMNESKVM